MKRIFALLTITLALLAVIPAAVAGAHTSPGPRLSDPFKTAMPDSPIPKRQKVVDKLKLRLAAITIENGFQTDIGKNGGKEIERWPAQYQGEELKEATRLGIFDLVNTSTQTDPREKAIPNTLPMQVRIFHERGTTPDELGIMMADVMRAIVRDPVTGLYEPTFGGLAIDTKPTSDGFIIPQETFQIDGAAVGFEVEFYTGPFNAYE